DYLQLFDFPTPAISAEKRFTTTVPLQRLFMMNSDFVQIESEEMAKHVTAEPNNRERIRKLYHLIYGREASETEIAVALDYLKNEPMKEYDEFKSRKSSSSSTPKSTEAGSEADAATDAAVPAEEPETADAGMMDGVPGFGGRRGQGQGVAKAPEYTATPLGRYAKVLVSSSEFMFIN